MQISEIKFSFLATVADFAEPIQEHRAGQRVLGLAFVQARRPRARKQRPGAASSARALSSKDPVSPE
jgi:hypothetical protein